MSDPTLRDRLAEIIKATSKLYPYGSDVDEGCRGIADALLVSEEWQAREAVGAAARNVAPLKPDGHEPCDMDVCSWHELEAALIRLAAVRGTA